jgi:hypothetical protein
VFLLYSYYLKGPRSNIAYFSAVAALTFITLIHLFIIFLLFKVDKKIYGYADAGKGLVYLIIFLAGLPVFLFYYFGVTEKRMENMRETFGYDHYDKEFNQRALLFTYIILLFVGLTIVILTR